MVPTKPTDPSPQPGSKVNLAPVAVRATFTQLKEHLGTTLGAAAVLCIPLAFIGVAAAANPGIFTTLIQVVGGGLIGLWVGYAATIAVGMFARGEDPGAGGLLRRSASAGLIRFAFTALAFNIVMLLTAFVAMLPLLMSLVSVGFEDVFSGRVSDGSALRILLGGLISFPLMAVGLLFVYLRLGLAQTAAALDATGPLSSLGRSWQVTRRRVWDFFLLILISVAISFAIGVVVAGPATIVRVTSQMQSAPGLSPGSFDDLFGQPLGPAQAVVTGVSGYLSTVLLAPLTAALLANFFLLAKNPPAAREPRTLLVPLRQEPGKAGAARPPQEGAAPEGRSPEGDEPPAGRPPGLEPPG